KSSADRAKLEISAIALHGGKVVDEIGLGAGFGHDGAPQTECVSRTAQVRSSCARTESPKSAGGINRKAIKRALAPSRPPPFRRSGRRDDRARSGRSPRIPCSSPRRQGRRS